MSNWRGGGAHYNAAGIPVTFWSSSDEQIKPRGERNYLSSDEYGRNLTCIEPPEWMNVNTEDTTPPCMRSKFWEKSWNDNLWDLDLRDSDREENDECAANLCAGCPIIEACLSQALEEEGAVTARNRYLIRGGKTPLARFELAEERGLLERRQCPKGHGDMKLDSRDEWMCRVCSGDFSRAWYARNAQDPDFKASRAEKQRQRRAAKRSAA